MLNSPPTALELCILASGSAGNAAILRCPSGAMLIDIGIGPRTTAKRLDGTGVTLADVRAVCLTHLDSDHFNPSWLVTLLKHRISVFCHHSRVRSITRAAPDLAELLRPFDDNPFEPLVGITLRALAFEHDEAGSHGFVAEGFATRVGYATDLGRVPPHLFEHFQDLDVLALESNYDPQMEMQSPRPWFLKQRIMNGHGHLSNQQAYEAVRRILDGCERRNARLPAHIVLLHRSRQCNCPKLLRKLFEGDGRVAPRLVLAEQYQRTEWLRPRPVAPATGEQLVMNWG